MRLITKYFSDIYSLKTCNNEVAELGVRLIAKSALEPNNYSTGGNIIYFFPAPQQSNNIESDWEKQGF